MSYTMSLECLCLLSISKHIGQGANQAFEDINLLTNLLKQYNPEAGSPSTATLDAIFTEIEKVRIPRTSDFVKSARAHGDSRVLSGVEACLARNNDMRELCKDPNGYLRRFKV
jgi:salicylate hydroxylase